MTSLLGAIISFLKVFLSVLVYELFGFKTRWKYWPWDIFFLEPLNQWQIKHSKLQQHSSVLLNTGLLSYRTIRSWTNATNSPKRKKERKWTWISSCPQWSRHWITQPRHWQEEPGALTAVGSESSVLAPWTPDTQTPPLPITPTPPPPPAPGPLQAPAESGSKANSVSPTWPL